MPDNGRAELLEGIEPTDRVKVVVNWAKKVYRAATDTEWLVGVDLQCERERHRLTTAQWRVIASDLAWWIRQRRDDDSDCDRTPSIDSDHQWSPNSIALLITAQLMRFDLRFDELDRYLRPIDRTDSMLGALHIFSRLGSGRVVSTAELVVVREAPDTDAKVLHCLMHGMCICPEPEPWAPLIVEIGNELERLLDRPDPVVFYRRAIGHRLMRNWETADLDMRRAVGLVPPDNSVHQQFHSELSAIASERHLMSQLQTQEARFKERIDEVRQHALGEIETTLRAGLTANFQILAIFVTLAGFLGTAGATVVRLAEDKISWGRGVATLTMLLVFTFAVFIGSRVLISGRIRRRKKQDGST